MQRFLTFIGRAWVYGVTVAAFLLISWIVFINPWRAAYLSLSELARASGQLKAASIQRSNGKGSHYFLRIALVDYPLVFDIRADQSEERLDTLLSQLQSGQFIKIYYEPAWKVPGLGSQSKANVYQVESAGRIVYSLAEVRQRYLNQGGWGLVFLCVVGLPILGLYWRHSTKT